VKKLLTILSVLFILSRISFAQEIVHGHVSMLEDNKEIPLTGATVLWLGTQKGTVTDANGHFEIESPGHDAHYLVVSFIGYEADTIHVHDHESEIKVILGGSEHLEEVEVSQRKSGTHISRKEPILTEIVTGEELCKAACCNLSESFETNAAVDVSFADAATGVKRIQMLGLNGLYVQTMTENNPNFRGLANNYGLEFIPGTWMSSIQVSKGAGSVINGYESITGQINIELKKPDVAENFINLYTNSFLRMEGNGGIALQLNDSWSTMLMAHGSRMNYEWDENNDNFLDDPLTSRYSVLNRWKYEQEHFNTQFGFTITGEERTGGQLTHNPEQPLDMDNGFGINILTNRFDGFMKSGYIFKNNENASIALVANYTRHEHDSYYGLREYNALQDNLHTNLIFQSTMPNEHHSYSTGVSFNYNRLGEQYTDTSMTMLEEVPGIFGQYTYNLDDKFVLLAGIRADHHSLYGLFFTPRVHLKYDAHDNFIIRASGGKGYRTPYAIADNSYLLASGRQLVFSGNSEMEEAWNYGISFTKYLHLNNKELTAVVDIYRTAFQKQLIIDIDTDPTAVYFRNLEGKSYANNYQAEIKYEPVKNLEMNVAYRYSDVKVTIQDQLVEKALVNQYKGLFTLSYQTNNKSWQMDYNVQLNGDGRLPGFQDEVERYPSYVLMSGQITKYFKSFDIYGGVENITGYVQENPVINAENPFSDTFDATQVWGPIQGRRFYVGLRYRFE